MKKFNKKSKKSNVIAYTWEGGTNSSCFSGGVNYGCINGSCNC